MIKFLDEYRDANLSLQIAEKIKSISTKKINIMEVCGGHTMAIRKNGIHKIVGDKINLISGPGCPVCVTSMSDIDTAIALSKEKDVILCTFGDLFYVPGTESSFAKRKAEGSDIRVVYSIHDALNFAKENKDKKVIFISIGFETTTPTSAACILEAKEKGIDNFFILALNKTMPYALKAILENEKCTVDALLCPGHVSTITGLSIYRFIVDELKIPCCISGFEPTDLMASVYILAEMCEKNEAKLINGYNRAVFEEGNEKAKGIMQEVFEESDASWRGVGVIPKSGLKLRDKYVQFDATKSFDIKIPEAKENPACLCGEILIGTKKPTDCTLFGKTCTPLEPKGACMVSSEGSCAAWYKYGE